MRSPRFRCTFLRLLKFRKFNRTDLISWREPILLHCWIIWSPLLYFNIKIFKDPNSSSFLRFQCSMDDLISSSFIRVLFVLHGSRVLFSDLSNFNKSNRGDLISWGNSVLQNGWIIWSPLLYFGFKDLNDLSSLSFIRFDWILHDSAVLFSYFKNLLKFRRRDRISWGNQFCRTAELFDSPFCISVRKSWTT